MVCNHIAVHCVYKLTRAAISFIELYGTRSEIRCNIFNDIVANTNIHATNTNTIAIAVLCLLYIVVQYEYFISVLPFLAVGPRSLATFRPIACALPVAVMLSHLYPSKIRCVLALVVVPWLLP